MNIAPAKLSCGSSLPSKHVISTVGVYWKGGKSGEQQQLAMCYRNSFKLAQKNNISSIAFPSISSGAYGYPIEKAAPVALKEIATGLRTTSMENAIMVCFSKSTYNAYKSAYKNGPWH